MFNRNKNDTITNLRKQIATLRKDNKELRKDEVVSADLQEIAAYSYENDILNLGNEAISIKRQQLLQVTAYNSYVRVAYKHLFMDGDTRHYTVDTRYFEHKESMQAAYDRIVELLVDAPADVPVLPSSR